MAEKTEITLANLSIAEPSTLIAYDGSGSTGGNRQYHAKAAKIIAKTPNARLLLWDHTFRIVTHEEMKEINAGMKSFGGTDPATIAQYVKSINFHDNLIIISDGQCGNAAVDACSMLIPNWKFKSVACYLIFTGGDVNQSITCPFTRNAEKFEVFLFDAEGKEEVSGVSVDDWKVLSCVEDIKTVEEFEAVFEILKKTIVAKTMGVASDSALRDRLLAMKKRLVFSISVVNSKTDNVTSLLKALEENRIEDGINFATAITTDYYEATSGRWASKVDQLVSMCEGSLRSAFDSGAILNAINFDRVRRADLATSVDQKELAESFDGVHSGFECPVTMDKANDIVLLLTMDDSPPILANIDKKIVSNLIDCPLNLFNYPDLVEDLKRRVDHPISLEAFKEFTKQPEFRSPLSRKIVSGGVCLGSSDDHCRASTWSLAKIFTGGKLVGNADMWYACIYLLANEIPYLKEIMPQVTAQMVYRLNNHKTFISMVGLPEYPTTRVPLKVAIWYVFASPLVGVRLDPGKEILRAHLPHIDKMKLIMALTGLPLPFGTDEHIRRLQVMLSMLRFVKVDKLRFDGLINALEYEVVEVKEKEIEKFANREIIPELVPIQKVASKEQVEFIYTKFGPHYQMFDVPTLVGLASLVDPSKSAGEIPLPFSWKPSPSNGISKKWTDRKDVFKEIVVFPETCRPYYKRRDKIWREEAQACYGEKYAEFSCTRMFSEFVSKYDTYPTKEEFLIFLYNRYVVHGEYDCLPGFTMSAIDFQFKCYAEVLKTVPASKFKERYLASVVIEKRILLEK